MLNEAGIELELWETGSSSELGGAGGNVSVGQAGRFWEHREAVEGEQDGGESGSAWGSARGWGGS